MHDRQKDEVTCLRVKIDRRKTAVATVKIGHIEVRRTRAEPLRNHYFSYRYITFFVCLPRHRAEENSATPPRAERNPSFVFSTFPIFAVAAAAAALLPCCRYGFVAEELITCPACHFVGISANFY